MNAHWVKFSERRPPNESKKYVIAFGGWSKEYHLTLGYYEPVEGFEFEDEQTRKQDYKDDWAFCQYNEDLDLIGMPDDSVDYWLEGLELPKRRKQ